jgi:hypothetical protein
MIDEHFWTKGAIDSDLIVIDDPQCKEHTKERAEWQWHPSYPSSRRRGRKLESFSDLISRVSASYAWS